jgi:hypothetical protein
VIHSEIDKLLAVVGVPDVEAPNKRTRLWAALHNRQLGDGASNCVIRFITEAMAPGRYLLGPTRFEALRDGLAEPLSLVGVLVNLKGEVAKARGRATTSSRQICPSAPRGLLETVGS